MIDAHHHLWRLAQTPQPWLAPEPMSAIRRDFDEDDLARAAASSCVTSTVVVQTVHDEDETTWLLAIADTSPLIAGVVGWADLTSPSLAERIARFREGPGGERLVGLRHVIQDEPDPDWLDAPAVRRGLATIVEAGLAFDLLVRTRNLPSAVRAVRDLPELRVVLDHLGKPPLLTPAAWPAWAAGVRALAAQPGVCAKISGLVTEADWINWTGADLQPAVDVALDAFGPQRLMIGSDWPVCLLATSYRGVVEATELLLPGLDAAEREQIRCETARTFYRLAPA